MSYRSRDAVPHRRRAPRRLRTVALMGALVLPLLAACGNGDSTPTLTWYINPDNGGQDRLAKKCSEGKPYHVTIQTLPNDATAQREQLVRRLAAKDSSIDLMSLDPPFVPEFSNAGFLRGFSAADAAQLTDGVLKGAVQSGTWAGTLMAAPFWANTQLLWFRRSV